ncbi:MAG TPA: acyl-CoA dehydrogenase family protein [Pseudogracilibacillus sp.]|nr:acyl-CoA dehydrogenase family protein [Pseudogracilibacillus sp.]
MEKVKRKVFSENINKFSPDHFNEEEKMIKSTVKQFVENQVYPELPKMEAHDYSIIRSLFKSAGDLGLLGADVSEDYGGINMGKKISGLIAEEMGHGSSFGVSFNIHTGVGVSPYIYFGTEEQKQMYLPKLTSGESIGAYALTEPGAGSDALATKTTAKKKEDGFLLNGEKQWITNAHVAAVYLVFAKTDEGITAFVVDRDLAGVSIGQEEAKLGIQGSSTATLILEDVYVSKDKIVGEPGKGHYVALNILNLARLKLAFSNLGAGKQALNTAINYGLERKQFNKSIIEFSMIKEKIANMIIGIYQSESSIYYTASLIDELNITSDNIYQALPDYAMDCALNKISASEMLDYTVDEGLQIHGGYGYMKDYDIERMYRDARINRIFEGTNEINRLTVTRSFFKIYKNNPLLLTDDDNVTDIYYIKAKGVLKLIMRALSESETIQLAEIEQEQELMRLLADIIKDVYTLRTVILRGLEKNEDIQSKIQKVIGEERLRAVRNNAGMILSRLFTNDTHIEFVNELKDTSTFQRIDIIELKRNIADYFIAKGEYNL